MTPKGENRRVYLVEQTLCHDYTKYYVLTEMTLDINLHIFIYIYNSTCGKIQ